MSDEQQPIILKGAMAGATKCGKSALLERWTANTFSSEYKPTGMPVSTTHSSIAGGKTVKVQCWDAPGEGRLGVITSSYYRGAVLVMLCCDVSDPTGAQQMAQKIWPEVEKHCKGKAAAIAVVGTKSDEESVACTREAQEFASEHNLPFFLTSSVNGNRVDEAFGAVIEAALRGVVAAEAEGAAAE